MEVSDQIHNPGTLHPREWNLVLSSIGCWAGPRVDLEMLTKRKITALLKIKPLL
jgi:hypothetical protein